MGKVARYTGFYDEHIFDDEQGHENKFDFQGPLKLDNVPKHQIKKMELLHQLCQQWGIQDHIMVAFLMRFIFKAYKPESPDGTDYEEAVKKLTILHDRMRQRDAKKNEPE